MQLRRIGRRSSTALGRMAESMTWVGDDEGCADFDRPRIRQLLRLVLQAELALDVVTVAIADRYLFATTKSKGVAAGFRI